MGGPQRSGVDPPLSPSHACLTAFIAFSVPFVFVSLGQWYPVLPPHLRESGEGWRSSIGFWALSGLGGWGGCPGGPAKGKGGWASAPVLGLSEGLKLQGGDLVEQVCPPHPPPPPTKHSSK